MREKRRDTTYSASVMWNRAPFLHLYSPPLAGWPRKPLHFTNVWPPSSQRSTINLTVPQWLGWGVSCLSLCWDLPSYVFGDIDPWLENQSKHHTYQSTSSEQRAPWLWANLPHSMYICPVFSVIFSTFLFIFSLHLSALIFINGKKKKKLHVHDLLHTHSHMHTCTHTRTHAHTHTRMHTHTHTQILTHAYSIDCHLIPVPLLYHL